MNTRTLPDRTDGPALHAGVNRSTHPLKELEIVLNAGGYHPDSGDDGGADAACECLREAADILNAYFNGLGFDDSGNPPAELAEAERRIAGRRKDEGVQTCENR